MIEKGKIKEAVEGLDPKDDTLWEKDGSPKISVLRALTMEPKLTADDVDEAVGVFKRPGGATVGSNNKPPKAAAPGGKPEEKVTATVETAPGPVEPARDRPKQGPDPRDPEVAKAKVEAATESLAEVRAQIDELEKTKGELDAQLTALNNQKTKDLRTIEQYSPQISHADAVKAIQKQTQQKLATQKDVAIKAAATLEASGVSKTFPSRLDEALALRRRTPEQQANYAKYVHQNAQSKAAGSI